MDDNMNCQTAFLLGYYGKHNLGDDLMCRATVDFLLRHTDMNIVIFSGSADAFSDISGSRVKTVQRSFRAVTRSISEADLVIQAGGTIFHDSYKGTVRLISYWSKLSLWLLIFLYARLIGKRFYMIGIGVLPQRHRVTRFLTSAALRLAHGVMLRDSASYQFAAHYLASDKLSLGNDLASLMDFRSTAAARGSRRNTSDLRIALSVCDLGEFTDEPGFSKHYWAALAGAINDMALDGRVAAVDILNFYTLNERSDGILGKWLATRFDPSIKVEIFDYQGNARLMIERIESADLLIAARYHASMIGALAAAPTVMIAYNRKTRDFAADAGLAASSVVGIEHILSSSEWREHIAGAIQVDASVIDRLRKMTERAIADILPESRKAGAGS